MGGRATPTRSRTESFETSYMGLRESEMERSGAPQRPKPRARRRRTLMLAILIVAGIVVVLLVYFYLVR